MKKRSILCIGLCTVTASSILLSAGLVQDTTEAAFEPTPAMITYMTPGAGHEALAPLEGEWNLTLKFRMTPDGPWEESRATSKREWIMDGRFLQEAVDSEWMGAPFQGRSLFGYDTLREEYTSVWFDNMGTGMMIGTGPAGDGATITTEGTHTDAMKNNTESWFRSVISIRSADEHVWDVVPQGRRGQRVQGHGDPVRAALTTSVGDDATRRVPHDAESRTTPSPLRRRVPYDAESGGRGPSASGQPSGWAAERSV